MGGGVSKNGVKKHEFGAPMLGQGMRSDISGVPVAGGQRKATQRASRGEIKGPFLLWASTVPATPAWAHTVPKPLSLWVSSSNSTTMATMT